MKRASRDRGLRHSSLNVLLTDDRTIRDLNRQFLQRNTTTDVIAFEGEGDQLGDIAISIDTAKRQARERGVSLDHELALLAVHGLLHLEGHDDTRPAPWRAMKRAEFETVVTLI